LSAFFAEVVCTLGTTPPRTATSPPRTATSPPPNRGNCAVWEVHGWARPTSRAPPNGGNCSI